VFWLLSDADVVARRRCLSQPESWRPRGLADPSPRQGHSLRRGRGHLGPCSSRLVWRKCVLGACCGRSVADLCIRFPSDVSTGAYTHGLAVYPLFPFLAAVVHAGTRCGALCRERRFFARRRCLSQPESWRPRGLADPSPRQGHSVHATWASGDGVKGWFVRTGQHGRRRFLARRGPWFGSALQVGRG